MGNENDNRRNRLTELCNGALDWIRTPEIPDNVVPIGRPTVIKNTYGITPLSDFDEFYKEVIKNMAYEEATAYVCGYNPEVGCWAIQYYKVKKEN